MVIQEFAPPPVFCLFIMRAAAQNQMTVKSLAVPIITVTAVTAAVFRLLRLLSVRGSSCWCHALTLFCRFKHVHRLLILNFFQGGVHIVTLAETFNALTL